LRIISISLYSQYVVPKSYIFLFFFQTCAVYTLVKISLSFVSVPLNIYAMQVNQVLFIRYFKFTTSQQKPSHYIYTESFR